MPVLKQMTKKILQQDRVILEDQAEQVLRFGDRYKLTIRSDAPISAVRQQFKKFYQQADSNEKIKSGRVLNTYYKV